MLFGPGDASRSRSTMDGSERLSLTGQPGTDLVDPVLLDAGVGAVSNGLVLGELMAVGNG